MYFDGCSCYPCQLEALPSSTVQRGLWVAGDGPLLALDLRGESLQRYHVLHSQKLGERPPDLEDVPLVDQPSRLDDLAPTIPELVSIDAEDPD